jgi:ribosome-binding protein aMBF1 (putative translation factor)
MVIKKVTKLYRYRIALLLGVCFLAGSVAYSQNTAPSANSKLQITNHTYDLSTHTDKNNKVGKKDFLEERMAVQDFISHVNEARRELALRQVDIAKQKIIMARASLPIIARVTPMQRRLTRVDTG